MTTIGTATVRLLAQVGDTDPVEVGDVEIPMRAKTVPDNVILVTPDGEYTAQIIADAAEVFVEQLSAASDDDFETRYRAMRLAAASTCPGDDANEITARAEAFYRFLTGE